MERVHKTVILISLIVAILSSLFAGFDGAAFFFGAILFFGFAELIQKD